MLRMLVAASIACATLGAIAYASPTAQPLRSTAPSAPSSASVEGQDELDSAIWVEGRVALPGGLPADEQVFVVARGKRFKTLGLHHAEVGADGSFRVGFHPKTKKGTIEVAGRYVWAQPYKLDVREPPAAIELRCGLGAHLEIVLTPPADLREDDPRPETIQLTASGDSYYPKAEARLRGDVYVAEFGGLPPAEYYVRGAPKGWAELETDYFDLAAGEHREMELQARLGVQIRGIVVDEDGQPIRSAQLMLMSTTPDDDRDSKSTTSAADGTFSVLGILPGSIEVLAYREGYLKTVTTLEDKGERDRVDDLRMVLDRGLVISGHVTWADGSPAIEASIVVKSRETTSKAKTEKDGSFTVSGLVEGAYRVTAESSPPPPEGKESIRERRVRQKTKLIAASEGVQAGTNDLVMTLSAGRSLSGRVVDAGGAPVTAFVVRYRRVDGSFTRSKAQEFESKDGTFTIEGLADGTWSIAAMTDTHAPKAVLEVSVPNTSKDPRLEVHEGVTISGRVVDADGKPLPDARITAWSLEAGTEEDLGPWYSSKSRVDAEGRYTIRGLAPGSIRLYVQPEDFEEGTELLFEMQPGEQKSGLTTTF